MDMSLPRSPGVYLFKDQKDRVIYIGKAIDLYHRVSSYFSDVRSGNVSVKTASLAREVHSVETIRVESELEALILEANLIKKYLPKFNTRLTDDKDYLYIKITKESFPRIITARKHDLKGSLKYFGPFPSSKTVRETLKTLRRVFPWCSNTHSRFVHSIPNREWKRRACFYYHIGLCLGACTGEITQEDYRKIINHFIKFLEGKKDYLVDDLTKEMNQESNMQNFEEAAGIKNTLDGINYLTQPQRVASYLENPNFLEDQKKIALQDLQRVLNLSAIPERIEGYDISNIAGKEATGSMVVLTNGEIDKSQYRKFKIRVSERPNDVAMMREMIHRRLQHEEWSKPDLMVVDGGRAQARAALFEILNFKFKIVVYGLAKRMEWLYTPDGQVIKLPRTSPALRLLQKLRDEAHRFAIVYHRQLHRRAMIGL